MTEDRRPLEPESATPVDVDLKMSAAGEVTVRSFSWQGRQLAVISTGRQWTEPVEAGLRRHVLVMAAGHGTFELCLEPADGLWHARLLSPHPGRQLV